MIYDDATCYKCGANAWTACRHRDATREPPESQDYKDRRDRTRQGTGGGRFTIRPSSGNGLNFKRCK